MQKEALINNTTDTLKKNSRLRQRTEPGVVAFYNIWRVNGAGLYFQPQSLHGAKGSGNYCTS